MQEPFISSYKNYSYRRPDAMEMLQMDVSIRHKGPHIQRSIDQKCCNESSHLIGCLDIFNNGI